MSGKFGMKAPVAKNKVILKAEALKTIILFAKRYANEKIPEYEWKEVYGFLIGRIVGENVHVDKAVPMTSGEATEVVFDTSHYSKAWELDNEIASEHTQSFVCGWWHTHPFKSNPKSVFMSSIDVMNHLGFQAPNPLAIALVHDPSKVKDPSMPYGIKIFRLTRTDFTEVELDKLALDLNPEGNTRSDENNWIYMEVPFEVVGLTPQLFFESLVDVIDKTAGGRPLEVAYKEEEEVSPSFQEGPGVNTFDQDPVRTSRLSNISDLSMGHNTIDAISPPSRVEPVDFPILTAMPDEMERANRSHVLPLEEFESDGERVEEASAYYQEALDSKVNGEYSKALKLLLKSERVYSRLSANHKLLFIKNEMMECYYWSNNLTDAIVESDHVLKLGEKEGMLYFMGNAKEIRGRKFLLGDKDHEKAKIAFQQAMRHYENGGFFAKAGACAEMIGRVLFNDADRDIDSVALFFSKALELYPISLNNGSDYDPEWARNGFLQKHLKLLELKTRELLEKIEDPLVRNRVSKSLGR
ncbi:MAG: hypothetical protein ACTSUE_21860 [Promethearchaeota archaeon]